MGEQADLILSGFVCQETGEVVDGDAPGYPSSLRDGRPKSDRAKKFSQEFRDAQLLISELHFKMLPM